MDKKLEDELDNLIIDLKSDKQPKRNKAFSKFLHLLSTQLTDVQKAIEGSHTLSWNSFYLAAHQGVCYHATKLHNADAKFDEYQKDIKEYSETLVIITQSASCDVLDVRVNYEQIVDKANEVLNNDSVMKYFGKTYLIILQKTVFNPKKNVSKISTNSWRALLKRIFTLLKSTKHQLKFTDLASCAIDTIEIGCTLSQLRSELKSLKVFTNLKTLLETHPDGTETNEIFTIIYQCVKNSLGEHRKEICEFVEQISTFLVTFFRRTDLQDKHKLIRVKLMDLIILAYCPNLGREDQAAMELIENRQTWIKLMSEYDNVMKNELTQMLSKYRDRKSAEINPILALCAARFCYYFHWKEHEENIDGEPSASKRIRMSTKVEYMMEKIKPSPNEFNWKWFITFSELIYTFENAINTEDVPVILQMLADCQSRIDFNKDNNQQIYAFTKVAHVLIKKEKSVTNQLAINLCKELWMKICDHLLRDCARETPGAVEAHALLQIIIRHEKYPSPSFIEDVLKMYTSNTINRNDKTLNTLIAILKFFNLDSLQNGKELAVKILNFAFQRHSIASGGLKKVITGGNEKTSNAVLAELATCCCLLKTDVINFVKKNQKFNDEKIFEEYWDINCQLEYEREIEKVTKTIHRKDLNELIIEDEDFLKLNDQKILIETIPTELKCIIDQRNFEALMILTEPRTKTIGVENSLEEIRDYIRDVLETNDLMMHLGTKLLRYHSLDSEKFNTSFINKRIVVNLGMVENLFNSVLQKGGKIDLSDTYNILISLKEMFKAQFHSVIVERIRKTELKFCLTWILKQVASANDEYSEQIFCRESFVNAKNYERIRYLAITTAFQYFYFEGRNTEYLVEKLITFDIFSDDNMDLHTIFEMIDICAEQIKVPDDILDWMWILIKQTCKEHRFNNYIMLSVCQRIDKFIKFSENDPALTNSISGILKAFAIMLTEEDVKLSQEVTLTFLEKFPWYHKNFFKLYRDESPTIFMYNVIAKNFLINKSFAIRLAAAKCLSTMMKFDIDADYNEEDSEIIAECFQKLFQFFKESIKFGEEGNHEPAFLIQLYTALFCASFHLRKIMIFEVAKIFFHQNYSDDIALKCFTKILKSMNCDARSLMDKNMLQHLTSLWIANKSPLNRMPYYFSDCSTFEAFIDKYYDTILLSLLKNNYDQAKEFIERSVDANFGPNDAIMNVFDDCLAFIIPVKANCEGIKYEEKAQKLQAEINKIFPKEKQLELMLQLLPNVITKLLANIIDVNKFKEISGFKFDFYAQAESITFESFERCIAYLKRKFSITDQSLMTSLCNNRKSNVEQIFMLQRSRIQSTELKEHKILYFLQYCILVEKTFDYLRDHRVQENDSIKAFLMREFVSFFGHLIIDVKYGTKLRETAANFLNKFLRAVIEQCINEFKPQMSRIMPSLMAIAQADEESSIKSKCLDIIEFLARHDALSNEVAQIDRFPLKFENLRIYQQEIKYRVKNFNLIDEIEHFLSVKNRNVEGLRELSEHLVTKKEELKELFEKIQFEGNQSLLIRLLRALIESIQLNDDSRKSIEAVKCLGEIGSHNLSKIVFIADDLDIYKEVTNVHECQKMICHKILDQMENLLLSSDPQIFEASSYACHHIFTTLSSQEYPESVFMRPYKSNSNEEVHLFYIVPKIDKVNDFSCKKFLENNRTLRYEKWLQSFCKMMMQFAGDKVLSAIPAFPLSLAETINSQVFQLIVHYDLEQLNIELLAGLNYFFDECVEALNYKEKTNEGSIFIDKRAIREMLKLVEVIRIYNQNNPRSNMAQVSNLNFLHIAKAAKYCEAFFSAIMYCEMWAQHEANSNEEKTYQVLIGNKILQDVMYSSYSAIGIKDTFDIFCNPFTNRLDYLKGTKQYLEMQITAMQGGNEDLAKVYEEIGLYHLVNKFSDLTKDQAKSKQYECLWRLHQWDTIVETEQELKDENGLIDLHGEFNKYHYLSLQCLKNGDEVGNRGALDRARNVIAKMLSQQSLECTKTLYKFLEMSHRLVQIEDFGEIRFTRNSNHEDLLRKWATHDELPFDYEQYEKILMQRNSIFDTANIKSGRRTWIPNANKANLFYSIKQAIIAGRPVDAYNIVTKLKSIEGMELKDKMELLIEESQLLMKTDVNMAKKCLKAVMDENTKTCILRAKAFRLYGEILAENYAQSFSEIDDKYLQESLTLLYKYAKHYKLEHMVPKLDNEEQFSQFSQMFFQESNDQVIKNIKAGICIFYTLAKYHDREFVKKCAYMKSPEYQNKLKIYERNNALLETMKANGGPMSADLEIRKAYAGLSKSVKLDEDELNALQEEKKTILKNALYNYVRSVIQSDDNDLLSIFRIISLTLDNFNSSKFLKNFLPENMLRIQSYKFIVALPQLVVRISNGDKDLLNKLLKSVLKKCAEEHPHHTLPLILAIKNSNADAEKVNKKQQEPRVLGAEQLWSMLRKDKKLLLIMEQLESMSTALIDLAYLECKDQIPAAHKLMKLKKLSHLQCPTVELPIRKNGQYPSECLSSIEKWRTKLTHVGGINAPKKIEVVCSDGLTRSQLLKGKDDMRQDAIMQQIFGVFNQLLMVNKEMKLKQAKIRTYRVVPFSCRSGILEWCSNTMPIGTWLVGNGRTGGAHLRLRPNDLKPMEALERVKALDKFDFDTRVKKFLDIYKNLKPVFHHFFYENFKSPGEIFERRFAYTVSVAVSSMIGYILGIGDRHVQNILIDMKTAEVIHIDFGIAFETGKCLPHPELIPFRLTRDIIDPMGVSGVDGIFRKTSEKTIEILRAHEKTLTTILEVLLYDPMYSWSVGTKFARAQQLDNYQHDQSTTEENHNAMATRALQRVQAKLQGFADNSTDHYPSIDGQIQYLIQQATDVRNLCRLFRGWQAYL